MIKKKSQFFQESFLFLFQDQQTRQVQQEKNAQRRSGYRLHQREEHEIQQKTGPLLRRTYRRNQEKFGKRNSSLSIFKHFFLFVNTFSPDERAYQKNELIIAQEQLTILLQKAALKQGTLT